MSPPPPSLLRQQPRSTSAVKSRIGSSFRSTAELSAARARYGLGTLSVTRAFQRGVRSCRSVQCVTSNCKTAGTREHRSSVRSVPETLARFFAHRCVVPQPDRYLAIPQEGSPKNLDTLLSLPAQIGCRAEKQPQAVPPDPPANSHGSTGGLRPQAPS